MYLDFYQISKDISLRKIDLSRVAELYEITKVNLKHLQYLEWSHLPNYSPASAYMTVANALDNWNQKTQYTYFIVKKHKIIGDFQIRPTKIAIAFEMGYWLDYKHRLQGITSTIVNYICNVNLKLNKKIAVLIIWPSNIPSVNLAISLGFIKYVGNNNPFCTKTGYDTYIKYLKDH